MTYQQNSNPFLSKPSGVYLTCNTNPISTRFGHKYFGLDTKEINSAYVGSCKTSNFLNDSPDLDRVLDWNQLSDGSPMLTGHALLVETRVLQALNAKRRETFYNESNGSGLDLGEYDLTSYDTKQVRDTVASIVEDVENYKVGKQQSAEEILSRLENFYYDESNKEKEMVSTLYLKIKNGYNIQVRNQVHDDSHIKTLTEKFQDERSRGIDPTANCKPVLLVNDYPSMPEEVIGNGHHSTEVCHKIGIDSMYVVRMDYKIHFNSDIGLVRQFLDRVNNNTQTNKVNDGHDAKQSLHFHLEDMIKKQGVEVSWERKLNLLNDNVSKKKLRSILRDSYYSDPKIKSAFSSIEKQLVSEKTLSALDAKYVGVQSVNRLMGQSRESFIKDLKRKYKVKSVGKGEFSVAQIGNCHSAAIRNYRENGEVGVLVCHVPREKITEDRDHILSIFKKDLMVERQVCPDIHIYVLPYLTKGEGSELFYINARDISV
jgi:hypothetical protein